MTIVPGYGKTPNRVLLCGEAPGKTEAKRGRPFAGKSGEEQKWYLSPYRINPDHWYMTNVVKTYLEGNPDPTPELILEWTPELIREVHACNPQLIIAVGRFAIQWFLGDRADLDSCHNIPHKPGAFDPSRASRSPQNSIILPVYHPAAGFYKAKVRPLIQEDYRVVASTIKKLQAGETIEFRHDPYAGREDYRDVTGKQLESALKSAKLDDLRYLGLDTEGYPRRDMHWSTQVSWQPGIAYVLRTSQPDLQRGIAALQQLADTGRTTFITHDASTPSGCLYDLTMSSVVGLNYSRAPLYNTMYAAYLTRLEPKGLKPLCWRFNGMYMEDYHSLIGDVARQKQLDYLIEVSCRSWPKPEPRLEHNNDGSSKLKTYQHITKAVEKIIVDIVTGKETKDGPTNPLKRWRDLDPVQVRHVESVMGRMPVATLDDVSLEKAVFYACLSKDSLVETQGGPRRISELVKEKYNGKVWSVDSGGQRILSKVCGWHRNSKTDDGDIEWFSVQTECSRFGRWGQLATRYTHNHKLMTLKGWKAISDLNSDDCIATGVERLSDVQRQIVIGSVLGDGSISKRNDAGWGQFRISHCENQKDYLVWKTDMLWGSPEIKSTAGKQGDINGRSVKRQTQFHITCPSHPELVPIRDEAYSGRPNEIVVGSWVNDLDALGLAIWYQDDGTLVSRRYPRIYTLAMSQDSVERLKEIMWNNFEIEASSYVANGNYTFGGHVLTVGAKCSDKFFSIIAPFVHPSMRYKIPESYRSSVFNESIHCESRGQYFSRVVRMYSNPSARRGNLRTSYCIDVEETHNFITTSGEVAHNCRDADATRRLMFPLMERLKSLDLSHRMPDDMQVAPIFWEMQQNGMAADRQMFVDLGESMSEQMYAIGARLSHEFFSSRPFNPGSPKQVQVLLKRRGLRASKQTDTGDESTAKKSIEHLRFLDPAIGLVFDWRERQHIRDSFCKPILSIIPEHERFYNVRSNLRIADTETRRLSSSAPNLLNIPVRTDIGRAVRSCYRLAEDLGQVLYAADLSQIELRILADESNSKFLIGEFLKPKSDPHKQIAMRVFGISNEQDVDEFKHRLPAKTTIYGISYGQQDQGLSDQLRMLGLDNWDVRACGELRREILSIIGINDYKDRLIASARSRGYIRDRGGMYRYLPDLRSRDRKLSAEAERHVVSSRIQGTAQTAIQNSMRHLRPSIQALADSGHDIKWRLQVHDELILTCPREDVEIVDYLCLDAMTNHHGLKLKIPIVAKGHTATTWGELK